VQARSKLLLVVSIHCLFPAVFGTHVQTVDKYGKAVSLFLYEVENSGK